MDDRPFLLGYVVVQALVSHRPVLVGYRAIKLDTRSIIVGYRPIKNIYLVVYRLVTGPGDPMTVLVV